MVSYLYSEEILLALSSVKPKFLQTWGPFNEYIKYKKNNQLIKYLYIMCVVLCDATHYLNWCFWSIFASPSEIKLSLPGIKTQTLLLDLQFNLRLYSCTVTFINILLWTGTDSDFTSLSVSCSVGIIKHL